MTNISIDDFNHYQTGVTSEMLTRMRHFHVGDRVRPNADAKKMLTTLNLNWTGVIKSKDFHGVCNVKLDEDYCEDGVDTEFISVWWLEIFAETEIVAANETELGIDIRIKGLIDSL